MNSVIIHLSLLHLVLLIMITNCKDNSEPATVGTCENFQSLNGIIRVIKTVNMALGDILASATFRAENIEDDVCPIHKSKNSSLFEVDYCIKRERDCSALYQLGFRRNGLYRIWPDFLNRSIPVYCDMETDGGGWTMIQRRGEFGKPHISFYEYWNEYKIGFGNVEEEFWLGNDAIFALTNQAPTILRIDLEDYDGQKRYAKYQNFIVRSEVEEYRITVEKYSGNSGDSMKVHNDKTFLTADKGSKCAKAWKGGWWYADCFRANLNGIYYNKADHLSYRDGVSWIDFKGQNNSLKISEMKVRPCNC